MTEPDEITRLKKRLARETLARQEAERLLEQKSLSLYESNTHLEALTDDLEALVKKRTDELTQALQRSEAGMLARQQFLAMMSHEIRTPLHGMLGLIDLLMLSPLNPEQAEHTRIFRSSGRSLLRILNDVLELSRIDSGTFDVEIEPLDLNSLLGNVMQLYRPLAHAKKLQLVWDSGPDLPTALLGDESRIRQILSNLLTNAIKFTHQGTVTLVSRAQAQNDGHWRIQFTVKDTGIGIDTAALPNLFNDFTQASFNIHKEFGGTGLGLSISRKLVELMGGSLIAHSETGHGSEFEVQLCLAESMQSRQDIGSHGAAADPAQNMTSLVGLRALVVDDNLVNRTLLASFLKRLEINAEMACDGTEAIQAITSHGPFHIVFMDLVMPCMDGLEATSHIRQLPIAQPYICGLSANAFKTEREKCLAEGMNNFLEKPLSFDRFCEFMRDEKHQFTRQ